MKDCYFITATGTDIGKTFVLSNIIRNLVDSGVEPVAIKPVISGYDGSRPEESDTGIILSVLQKEISISNIDDISPWRFKAALSPDMAARMEGRHIDYTKLKNFCMQKIRPDTLNFIEGVGGLMSPICEDKTNFDLIKEIGAKVILVSGSYLGSITHTLTCLELLKDHNVQVAALVISESENSDIPLSETEKSIAKFSGLKNIFTLTRFASAKQFAINLCEIIKRPVNV